MTLAVGTFTLHVRPTAGAPEWVEQMTVGSGWQYLAGGPAGGSAYWPASGKSLADWQRGNRIVDVRMDPSPQAPTFSGLEDVVQPWNGAAYNPDRHELYFPANGGGGSYTGNEVYALQFNQPVPGWKLLSESTPVAFMETGDASQGAAWDGTDFPCCHYDGPTGAARRAAGLQPNDGRPRAFHSSANIQYANGRIWNVMQTATTPNLNTQGLWSWDREWVAQQPNERAIWTDGNSTGNILPWRWHGVAGLTGNGPGYAFACTAFDPVTNRIWGYADRKAWAVDALSGGLAVPAFTHNVAAQVLNGQTRGGWAVYVPGTPRRIFVGMCRRQDQAILVHNLDNNTFSIISATPSLNWDPDSYWSNWGAPGIENGGFNIVPGSSQYNLYLRNAQPYLANEFSYGLGAVYSDGLIYIGVVNARNGGTLGGQVRVLNVAAFLAGEECLTELVNTGERPIALAEGPGYLSRTQWGNWQRFNMVQFGASKVLVHAADAHGPTHVWRIA